MRASKIFTSFILVTLLLSCQNDSDSIPKDSNPTSKWLIPPNLVIDVAGIDGIPALSFPVMAKIGESGLNYLDSEDLVLVYRGLPETKVYSHKILDYHEIINDQIGDHKLAITYCPLTGTGIGWGRELNGVETTFGVSGFLYETNLMPYDRSTLSYWSQMYNSCVNGKLRGTVPDFYNLIQMNYGAAKQLFPNAQIITENTGYDRDYKNLYPYASYNDVDSDQILFPITHFDSRLNPKEFVRGVFYNNESAVYRFPESGRVLIKDIIGDQEVIVVADKDKGYIVSFLVDMGNTELDFSLNTDVNSPLIMEDQLGNKWDIFGVAVEGPNRGEQLQIPYSYMGYWFAIANFYPEIRIFGQD